MYDIISFANGLVLDHNLPLDIHLNVLLFLHKEVLEVT